MLLLAFFHRKVFRKLGFEVSDDVIQNVTNCKPWAMEQFMLMLRQKLASTSVVIGGHSVPASHVNDNSYAESC
jgi:hypothetical protein